jgi:hypothetical protein
MWTYEDVSPVLAWMLKNYTREHRSIKVKVMCYMTDGHVQSYEQLQIKTTLNIIALVQDKKNYLEMNNTKFKFVQIN